jgi:hypothetical protein
MAPTPSPAEVTVPPTYLSPAEFSRRSGLSPSTVGRLLPKRRIPFWQPGGPHTRVLIPAAVLDLVAPDGAALAPSARAGTDPPAGPRPGRLPGPAPKWTQT